MATKYHVNNEGKVERCRAFIRPCPFQDYRTEETARAAMYIREEKDRIEGIKNDLNNLLAQPKTSEHYIDLRLTTDSPTSMFPSSPLAFAEKIENLKKEKKDSSIITVNARVDDTAFNPSKVKITMTRFPRADYDAGRIGSTWKATIQTPRERKEIPLDFENDYAGSIKKLRPIIHETVLVYLEDSTYSEDYNEVTDRIINKMGTMYAITEEETMGPYEANEMFKENRIKTDGTFAESKDNKILFDKNINETTFRAELLDRYIKSNHNFKYSLPKSNFRILDTENGKSYSWWGITYNDNDGWGIQSRAGDNDVEYKTFEKPEEIQEYVRNFVKDNMDTNNDQVANARAEYAGNLMRSVNEVFKKHSDSYYKDIEKYKERVEAMNNTSKEGKLYGKTKEKNTANSILNMFS